MHLCVKRKRCDTLTNSKPINMQFRLLILCLLGSSTLLAQLPQSFRYQAVVRDAAGIPIEEEFVKLRFTIIEGSLPGVEVYSEEHPTSTNEFGLVSMNIGQGIALSGAFSDINWSTGNFSMRIELSADGSSPYEQVGNPIPLLTVPYAFYAAEAGSVVGDDDPDPTNELQTLSMEGESLSISNGNTVVMPSGIPRGTILPFAGPVSQVPEGYILCDGQEYSTQIFPDLYVVIGNAWGGTPNVTFAVPDLRGQFMRGVDSFGLVDIDANSRQPAGTLAPNQVGSYQEDAFQTHRHDIFVNNNPITAGAGVRGAGNSTDETASNKTSLEGGSETRPKNAYVNFIIKY